MRSVCVVLALAGCGRLGFGTDDTQGDANPAPPFVPDWQSGTRIRARTLAAADGSDPMFAGWRDTMLDTDCLSQVAADGKERCLPGFVRSDLFYADAGCTAQPLAATKPKLCGLDRFAVDNGRVFAIGAVYAGPVFDRFNNCAPANLPPEITLHVVGAEMPTAAFILAVYEQQRVGDHTHLFGGFEDGSRLDFGLINTDDGSCAPVRGKLGASECRAQVPQASAVYLDAQCMQRGYFWDRQPFEPAATSRFTVPATELCGTETQLFDAIADVTAPKYFVRDLGGACRSIDTPANAILYTAQPSTVAFPSGDIHAGPRRGRLGTLYWATSDGIEISLAPWDHELATPCRPFRATDGVLRCLPEAPQTAAASSDATCTGATQSLTAACWSASAPLSGPTYSSCEDQGFPVKALPRVGDAASIVDDGTCRAVVAPGGVYDPSGSTGEVPPEMFPALIETIE